MRKSDLELLEMRLEPHGTAIDRLTADMGQWLRAQADMVDRVKDLERNEEIHKMEIAQGLASIRSLLQRANRLAKETGMIEEEEVADPEPAVKIEPSRDDVIRAARLRHARGNLL